MKLTVVMVNQYDTEVCVQHLNEHMPFKRRTVQIALTLDQMADLQPRKVGEVNGRPQYEVIGEHWLEMERLD